jgi:hypothetical protein
MDVFEILSSLFMLLCSVSGIICTLIFISVIIIDRQCRTMTALLVFNSIIAGFIVNIVYACQALYQLVSDEEDKLCVFRGFLLHITCGLLYHTFCVQALYRLVVTMPVQQQYLRSKPVVLFIVLLQWLISLTFGLPILLNGQIKYQAGSRICQVEIFVLYFLKINLFFFRYQSSMCMGFFIYQYGFICFLYQ